MSWLAGKYLAFDLETTSKYPDQARIVTATTIEIDPTTGAKDVTNWLSDVDGHEIPEEQAIGLARYFASQGNDEHVPTEWPIRLTPAVTG